MSNELVTVQHPVDAVIEQAPLLVPGVAEVIPFPSGRYAIPPEDMAEFTGPKYSRKEQDRVKFLLALFARMESGGLVAVSELLGKQLAGVRGYGASNLRTFYYRWKQLGWRGVARNFTNGGEKLPPAFVQRVRADMENNARSMKQAMNSVIRDWYAGEAVEGYGTWREWFATAYPEKDMPLVCPGLPKGWKKSNLYAIQPVKAMRALKTRGFAAMKAELPSMVRDTSKLLPLQLVVIDDVELDQYCYVRSARAVVPMSGVAAMDVATRRIIGFIVKPRLPNFAGRKQSITRAEVRLLLFQILREHGVPAHGMTILAENAAAAITTELELTFGNLFGGKIAVTRTSMIDRAVLQSGFRDTGGKPWLKGWIESFFNLLHNYAASIAGQKGANYLVKPAELEQKLKLTQKLIGVGDTDANLSDAQLAKARVPFKSPEQLIDLYLQILRWIEDRTDHAMLGFEDVLEWRRDGSEAPQPWDALAKLTPAEQLAVEVLPPRKQSPRERWLAMYPRISRHVIPTAALMLLCLTPKRTRLLGCKLTFTHSSKGYTWIVDPRSEIIAQVQQGADVLCYFDPTQPDHAHVTRLDGRYLGEVKRFGPVDLTDADAVSDAERTMAELYNAVQAEVRERPVHQAEELRLAEDSAVNAALVSEAKALRNTAGVTATLNRPVPQTPTATTPAGDSLAASVVTAKARKTAERQQAKALRAAGNDVASLLDDPAEAPAAPAAPHNYGSDLL